MNRNITLELLDIARSLEKKYHDAQDIEFTIEKGKLYILYSRSSMRTNRANIKIAVDLFVEEINDINHTLNILSLKCLTEVLNQSEIINKEELSIYVKGLPASPGAYSAPIFIEKEVETSIFKPNASCKYIYVCNELPKNSTLLSHLSYFKAVISTRGGMTSHAAVVARGIGIPCVSGCADLIVKHNILLVGKEGIKQNDYLTIDGANGIVYKGEGIILKKNWRKVDEVKLLHNILLLNLVSEKVDYMFIGKAWMTLDIILNRIVIEYRLDITHEKENISEPYIAFSEPNVEIKDKIKKDLLLFRKSDHENYTYIIKGIINFLVRILSEKNGHSKHHLYVKPCLDPMNNIIKNDDNSYSQIVSLMFFDIDKYIDELNDIQTIKIDLLVDLYGENEEIYGAWMLDRTSRQGESLILGAENFLSYRIEVNNAMLRYQDLPQFYDGIRKRSFIRSKKWL